MVAAEKMRSAGMHAMHALRGSVPTRTPTLSACMLQLCSLDQRWISMHGRLHECAMLDEFENVT